MLRTIWKSCNIDSIKSWNLYECAVETRKFRRGNLIHLPPRYTHHFLISSPLTKMLFRANLTEAVYELGDRVKRTSDKKHSLSRQTVKPVTDIARAGRVRGRGGRYVFSKPTASICRPAWNGYWNKRCRTSTEQRGGLSRPRCVLGITARKRHRSISKKNKTNHRKDLQKGRKKQNGQQTSWALGITEKALVGILIFVQLSVSLIFLQTNSAQTKTLSILITRMFILMLLDICFK